MKQNAYCKGWIFFTFVITNHLYLRINKFFSLAMFKAFDAISAEAATTMLLIPILINLKISSSTCDISISLLIAKKFVLTGMPSKSVSENSAKINHKQYNNNLRNLSYLPNVLSCKIPIFVIIVLLTIVLSMPSIDSLGGWMWTRYLA